MIQDDPVRGEAAQEEQIRARLAQLSPEKRALLEQKLLQQRRGGSERVDVIPRRASAGPAPLSITQELLWLVQQLDLDSYVYNSSGVRKLTGPLDVDALRSAFDAVVARHESLRTTFHTVGGEPVQVVSDDTSADFQLVDISQLDAGSRELELRALIDAEIRRPFDLEHDRMERVRLVRLAPEEHVLVIVGHHIAWDGWSKGILYRELAACYDAFVRGAEPELEPLRIQYPDFAVWQREWLEGPAAQAQMEYWRRQLADAPALLELPTDHVRPPEQRHRGARQSLWLPPQSLDALRTLSRGQGGTLFMTLTAALAVLLNRYSGQEDILIGTPIAGRNRSELENLIGYFTNTLVLRTDVSGDPTFAELFGRVREVALGAFANQDAPFERLVRELVHERSASHSPLFQVMFVLQNQSSEVLEFSGVRMTMLPTDPKTSKFDLTIGVGERPEGLHASFEYDTDLFEATTIERMRGHYRTLLEGILADPGTRISRLPLLTQPERVQILVDWAAGGRSASPGTIHELLDARADAVAADLAASAGKRILTYGDLRGESDALARRLVEAGVGRGDCVGIFMDRGLEVPIAMLAILKAGATCVPLDPAYPRDRLEAMQRAATLRIVLAQVDRADDVAFSDVTVLTVEAGVRATSSPETSLPEVTPDDVAYLVFTSGSTGRPRGVELQHRGLVNHALAAVALYGLRPDDRVLQLASISFDISLEEMLPTWLAGGSVVFLPPKAPIAGPGFRQWLVDERVTVMDLPTAYWHEWVNDLAAMGRGVPQTLRTLIVGGERALASAYRTWLTVGGDRTRFFNTYGPTEASVIVTAWESDVRRPEDVPDDLPIGTPVANARLYVLDRHFQPVPIGVPGELFIGGPGVARGYRGDEQATAERFVTDPYGESGSRLYRTGDAVRWAPDGSLQFVGRTDAQLKIRGFRVEPGEVEAAIGSHPRVREAVVLARGEGSARRLVAYVVPFTRPGPVAADLKAYLRERLPDYMVPAAFVELTALPMSANGKVAREALPEPEGGGLRSGERTPPRDDLERELAGLWQRLLGLPDEPGVEEDFFELGGYSLLAVRLFAEIERRFGVRLQLVSLFRAATIADVAAAIRASRSGRVAETWDTLVELAPGDASRPPLFLAPWLDGQVIGYRNLIRHLDPDQPVYGLQAVGVDGRSHPHVTIEEMATHYVTEVRRRQPGGPYLLGGYCFGGAVAYEMAYQLHRAGEEVALLALIDAPALPFVHRREPKTRAELERARWSRFRQGDLQTKLEVLARIPRGIKAKLVHRLRWRLFDVLRAAGIRLPRALQNVERVNRRATQRYTTPQSPCPVTLFRIASDTGSSFYKRSFWTELAAGGLEVRGIVSEGITHLTMMEEPHARALAVELNEAIGQALAEPVEELAASR